MSDYSAAIDTEIETYRGKISSHCDSMKSILEAAATIWNDTSFPDNGSGSLYDISVQLDDLTDALVDAAKDFDMQYKEMIKDRPFADQGTIGTAELIPYVLSPEYDSTDYTVPIIDAADKNLEWTNPPIDSYKFPKWDSASDIDVDTAIANLRKLGLSLAGQLAVAEEQIELVSEIIKDKMDMAGAQLGAKGYRKANSWLKRKQMDAIWEFEDKFYEQNKEAAHKAIGFQREAIQEANALLLRATQIDMEYNRGHADMYDAIAKTYFQAQGLLNDIAIEAFALDKRSKQQLNELNSKIAIMGIKTEAKNISALFESKYIVTMAKWDTETKRISDALKVEEDTNAYDAKTRENIYMLAIEKLTSHFAAASQLLSHDGKQASRKLSGLKNAFDKTVAQVTGAAQTKIAITEQR